jgi:type IV pili sensor histidine kinase/response regulator
MDHPFFLVLLILLLLTGCAHQLPIKPSPESDPVLSDQTKSALISDPLEQSVQIGRYSVVSATPTAAQDNILSVIVTVNMPAPIETVGDAIHHLLTPSGYSLARFDAQGPEVIQLLSLPLPDVHRTLGPMSLQDALLTLASPAFRLYTDPVHRLIAYDLKPDYQLELAP